MSLSIESLTSKSLIAALDAASLRQQVIATNIANVNTDGYVAQNVTFESRLAEAAAQLDSTEAPLELHARIAPHIGADGLAHAVRLDDEVAQLSQNQVHYQALLKGINKHLGLIFSAATEGKR
jgi:flagellar basal-body rod protein FlgB